RERVPRGRRERLRGGCGPRGGRRDRILARPRGSRVMPFFCLEKDVSFHILWRFRKQPDTVTPDQVTPDNVAPDKVTPETTTRRVDVVARALICAGISMFLTLAASCEDK